MKNDKKKIQVEQSTTLNGMMTFGIIDNRQHILDFVNTGYAEMDPFIADCKVQGMRDGNVYITERPRRQRHFPSGLQVVAHHVGQAACCPVPMDGD